MLHFTTKNTWTDATDAKPLPYPLPAATVSRCAPSQFVCRTHVNEVLIVACPLWVTFGFVSDLCGMFPGCPRSPFLTPLCDSLHILHNIWVFSCKTLPICRPLLPKKKTRRAPWQLLEMKAFFFSHFPIQFGKSRHTAAVASIKKCAGTDYDENGLFKVNLGKGLLLSILWDFIKIYHRIWKEVKKHI